MCIYFIFPKFIVEPQPRIRKPSKRLLEIDPLATITPARPKAKGRQKDPAPVTPAPLPPTSFASRQIQASQNRLAATVLFTPRRHRGHPGSQQDQLPPSPTPYRAYQTPLIPTPSSSSSDTSDLEDEVRNGLQRLDLQPQSSSGSQSPASPRAGPHSKVKKVAPRPRGGAKDVWVFFEKPENSHRHTCVLCK
jgi:hypothetical protein